MMTQEQKEQVCELFEAGQRRGGMSMSAYCRSLDLSPSDGTNIVNRKWVDNPQLISEKKWKKVADAVGFKSTGWVTAETQVTRVIRAQLKLCQAYSSTGIFCDEAGIGKTHTAKEYASHTPNAFYINIGNAPTRYALVREIASRVGLDSRGTMETILRRIVAHVVGLDTPILIFDEAGDLKPDAILVMKRIYNELEDVAGMYMLGARGLEKMLDRGVRLRVNGFEEVFSRFGEKYTKVVPELSHDRAAFMRENATLIAEANGVLDAALVRRVVDAGGDFRRTKKEITKLRIQNLV